MIPKFLKRKPKTVPAGYEEPDLPWESGITYHPFLQNLGLVTEPKKLTKEQVAAEAKRIEVPRANLLTILSKESSQLGFHKHSDGRWYPTARYEAHQASRRTDGMFDKEHPELFRPWDSKSIKHGNVSQEEHYRRITEAMEIAGPFFGTDVILQSTSWGCGQIMGFNARMAGKGTPERMVEEMANGVVPQLQLLTAFLENTGVRQELAVVNPKLSDWRAFARQYNGLQNADVYAQECARIYFAIVGGKTYA